MSSTKPTHRKHNPAHDYSERCIYHITLVVSDKVPLFGQIIGDTADKARMELTPLGFAISEEIQALPSRSMAKDCHTKILAKIIMPEHIHFVFFVEEPMPCKLHMLMRGFKQGCNRRLREWLAKAEKATEVGNLCLPDGDKAMKNERTQGDNSQSGLPSNGAAFPRLLLTCGSDRILHQHALFEEDYDETILRRHGQLKRMLNYVHENPYRKWVKRNNRNRFRPVRGIEIAGRQYDAIGNLMLLGLQRFQVHCRHRWEVEHDIEARRGHQNECIIKARHNHALLSPFISEHEVAVRDHALKEGHSIIQIMDNGFSDFTTCPGNLFDYCEQGQVLLLVPSDVPHEDRKGRVTREECRTLNALAEEIVAERS